MGGGKVQNFASRTPRAHFSGTGANKISPIQKLECSKQAAKAFATTSSSHHKNSQTVLSKGKFIICDYEVQQC